VNIYEIMTSDGASVEIEADFYERKGEDWVFFAGDFEVTRLPMNDVQGVLKVPNPPPPTEPEPERFI